MKNKYYGWKKVFEFTFRQMMRSPGTIFMLLLMLALSIGAVPMMKSMAGITEPSKESTSVEELILIDKTDVGLATWFDLTKTKEEAALPEKISFSEKTFEELEKAMKAEKEEKKEDSENKEKKYSGTLVVEVTLDQTLHLHALYEKGGDVKELDGQNLCSLLSSELRLQLLHQRGVSDEQMAYIETEIDSEVVDVSHKDAVTPDKEEEEEEEEDDSRGMLNMMEMAVTEILMILVVFIIALSGEQIASHVLEEKASKLVDFLLTSVTPNALMLGKVLAVFVVTLLDIAVMIGGVIVSWFMFGADQLPLDKLAQGMEFGSNGTLTLQLIYLPISIAIALVGAFLFAVIAAVAGATVSRMEELTEAMKVYSLLMIVGAYAGMFIGMSGPEGALMRAVAYVPLSAPFFTPGYLLIGRMGLADALISLVIMVITTAVVFTFATRVYESLLYYRGKKLKLKELLMMGQKGGAKNE